MRKMHSCHINGLLCILIFYFLISFRPTWRNLSFFNCELCIVNCELVLKSFPNPHTILVIEQGHVKGMNLLGKVLLGIHQVEVSLGYLCCSVLAKLKAKLCYSYTFASLENSLLKCGNLLFRSCQIKNC